MDILKFIATYWSEIPTYLLAISGFCAWLAAFLNKYNISGASKTLLSVSNVLGGNVGPAQNAIDIAHVYKTAGPEAAIDALIKLLPRT